MCAMEKSYNPTLIESHWNQTYVDAGIGKPSGDGAPYCMMIPPPNVTGTLHMGHGFQYALMDTIIRYQRMKGKKTLWQMGTDHAGIATQMVVERQLLVENQTKEQLGREAFVDKIWAWKDYAGSHIEKQIQRLGASVDWDTKKFTLDKDMHHAVCEAFVRLHEAGLIYRGEKLVNWDPTLQTAVSDLEVDNQETTGTLWHIRYPIEGNKQTFVEIATTRPETLFGDVAIAVSPEDSRYQHLLGKRVHIPCTDRLIPIIADVHVDPEFGTGCVKVTPAHDFNDYAIGKRHDLPLRNIFLPDARLNDQVPLSYQGLDRFVARERLLVDLREQGLLVAEKPHTMIIPVGDRSGSIIEPYLTKQWFIRMKDLAAPALQAVADGDITFHPENWVNTYRIWLEGIEDWCISRQLWWGHRIPVWYDAEGNSYVGTDEAAVRAQYQLDPEIPLEQDADVLDTWFSSALWPFATLGWPQDTERLATFFPTELLVTGFDIIFFWVARMIMFSLYFTGKVPFKAIYVTGLIRDHEGQKMSKSKGNTIDPIDLIDGITLADLLEKRTRHLMQPDMKKHVEKATKQAFPDGISAHGTDALRFTFAALATPGRDIRFDSNRLTGYRNFCNKLWNASRYVHMHVTTPPPQPREITHPVNQWLADRLHKAIIALDRSVETYRLDLYAQTLYELIWHNYCDWYIELSKPLLKSSDATIVAETRYVLIQGLETIVRLAHPLIPFITESIWQSLRPLHPHTTALLATTPYPCRTEWVQNDTACQGIEYIQALISGVRTIKSAMNIPPKTTVPIVIVGSNIAQKSTITDVTDILCQVGKITNISWHSTPPSNGHTATFIANGLEVFVLLEGLIDLNAERARLDKTITQLTQSVQALNQRLNNPRYCDNAPAEVVEKTRQTAHAEMAALEKLHAQRVLLANGES